MVGVEVGDTVLVMPGFEENLATEINTPEIDDTVILYNLRNDTKIAIPVLSFSLGDLVINSPSFDFAGFNWNIDFDFNLIQLDLPLYFVVDGEVFYVGDGYSQIGGFPRGWEKLIGTLRFSWDGLTRVWLSNYEDHIYAEADDGYRIYNISTGGMLDLRKSGYGVYLNNPLPEITSVLSVGYNILEIYVKDWYGAGIYCPDVWCHITL